MKILVTGGAGFAGRHLLRQLLLDGSADVAATVLRSAEIPVAVPELEPIEWVPMDVTSDESVREVVRRFRPELIYHLAGQASVGESFEAPLTTWEVNATGTLRLMVSLGELTPARRRLLLISSAEVYGVVEPEEQPIREDAAFRPVTPYGASKAAAELTAVQMGPVAGVEVVVARSFNHIGPGQDERFVLPSMALQLARMAARGGERTLQVGNLEVERDFLDVRDVARAYIRLMQRGEAGEAYNVCSGEGCSLLRIVQRLIELSEYGVRLEIDRERVRPVDIPVLVGDPGKLRALGWAPALNLDEALRDLLTEAEARA